MPAQPDAPCACAEYRRLRGLGDARVHAILTEEDLPEHDDLAETSVTNEPLYEGEAILAVAADNEWIAANAIEKIKVDLEPLPFALDPLQSLRRGGSNARTDGNTIIRETPEGGGRPTMVVKDTKWDEGLFVDPGRLPMGEPQGEWTSVISTRASRRRL